AGPDGPVRVTVDTHVVEHYGPGAGEVTRRRLLEVQTAADAGGSGLGRVWGDAREAFTDFMGLFLGTDGSVTLPGLGLMVQVLAFVFHEKVPLVFLKQFRDVADGRRACYQAIVEAPAQVLRFRTAGELRGAYRVVLHHFDSCPIARDLGLTAEG